MSINLSKGQKVDLTKGNPSLKSIMVGLGWDVNAFDSGADFDPKGVDVSFKSEKGSIELLKMGTPIIFDEDKALEILKERDIIIDVTLHEGTSSAKAWGCDLSYEYVKINGEYRS